LLPHGPNLISFLRAYLMIFHQPSLSHFQLESKRSNKSLQATQDGGSSSASRLALVGPACLSFGR
jgi:hypothetical protein